MEYYVPDNLIKETEEISLSGNYRLVIGVYKTGDKTWDYTQGKVYLRKDNTLIATIQRNYPTFHYSFITTRQGKEYLFTGRRYTGMTILDLETKQEWDHCSKRDFCATRHALSPDEKVLIVYGCYWGSPYEYKFYDFDLSRFTATEGLPELTMDFCNFYLEEDGFYDIRKGESIPEKIKGNLKLNPDGWYYIFTYTVDYHTKAKMKYDDLISEEELWLQVAPKEFKPALTAFEEKWSTRNRFIEWNAYYEERLEILEELKPHLKEDRVRLCLQKAILQRVGNKMKFLMFEEYDDETGEMISKI